jgi:hypothetical protein
MGSGPSDGVNGGLGVGDPSVTMEIPCHLRIAQSSAQDSNTQTLARASAIAKTWFSM